MAIDFQSLKAEYAGLWPRMQIRPERVADVTAIANRLIGFKARYQQVAATTRVPWFIIAVLHQREASADFNGVLHNGEEIIGTGRRTRLVPANRGPFSTWEEAAADALMMPDHKLHEVGSWTIERTCYEIEKYNGFGYRKFHINSPYLWSFSNNYSSGKYVADRQFDAGAVDKQCGTMPILKRMMELDASVRLDGSVMASIPQPGAAVLALQGGSIGEGVRQLQTALASQGFQVGEIDGEFGPNTEAAVRAFQLSRHLPATGVADQATMQALVGGARPTQGGTLQPADILSTLLNVLKARGVAPAPGTTQVDTAVNPLQIIIGALLGKQTDAASAPILSPIDKALGGEALAGKKTALSVIAYVVLAILKAVGVGASVATPAGQAMSILTILVTAFGALGGTAKVDRVVQALGVIAAKPK